MSQEQQQIQFQRQREDQTRFQIQSLLSDVLSREDEIRKIEQDMRELHELFKDVHSLVKDQTIMIDNIERNVEAAVYNTDQGVLELAQAKDNQSSCVIS